MTSRALVSEAMQGRADRLPLYFWLADPKLEATIGDIVGVRCWFKCLDFFEEGGPFKRGVETRREWCNRIDPDAYKWPTVDDLVAEMDEIVADTIKVDRTKSFQLEILGPTEYSESSCSSGKTPQAKRLGQISHQFDFSILTVLNPKKADMIHAKFFYLSRQIIKRAIEYDEIDSIRIADDFCGYMGSIYKPEFAFTIVRRQVELGRAITKGGKYSILHSDGDLTKYITAMAEGYSGFHPLDIRPKSTPAAAREWASALAAVRRLLPDAIFFTGIPIDLLCNSKVSEEELVDVAKCVIDQVGLDRLILTTTHRPYPGWSFRDFENKAKAIREYVQSISHSPF